MNKQEQIAAKAIKPFEVGDYIEIKVPYQVTTTTTEGRGKNKRDVKTTTEHVFSLNGTILKIEGDSIQFKKASSTRIPSEVSVQFIRSQYSDYNDFITIEKEFVFPTFKECGANPFTKNRSRVNFYNKSIEGILLLLRGKSGRINFNPYVETPDGIEYYQRGLVWTEEQKKLLIDSIYQNIEIGKFLFRKNTYEREVKTGFGWDLVDGKQRLTTIIDFINNKFTDSYGNYFKDLSDKAQTSFVGFDSLSYGELDEKTTDRQVSEQFLKLNFTGTPMSPEHIEYVKSINQKFN